MSLWIYTVLYFISFSCVFLIGFMFYGRSLLLVGEIGGMAKNIGGMLIYATFAIVLTSPFLLNFEFVEVFKWCIRENGAYALFFGMCYVVSIIPGVMLFKHNYIKRLKTLGFFKR